MTDAASASKDIRHDIDGQRFLLDVEGATALIEYARIDERTLDYNHTFVPGQLRGRGIASVLTEHALRYAREQNFKVVPSCPFVSSYIDTHPEYRSLVA